jgi:hypothetical protein
LTASFTISAANINLGKATSTQCVGAIVGQDPNSSGLGNTWLVGDAFLKNTCSCLSASLSACLPELAALTRLISFSSPRLSPQTPSSTSETLASALLLLDNPSRHLCLPSHLAWFSFLHLHLWFPFSSFHLALSHLQRSFPAISSLASIRPVPVSLASSLPHLHLSKFQLLQSATSLRIISSTSPQFASYPTRSSLFYQLFLDFMYCSLPSHFFVRPLLAENLSKHSARRHGLDVDSPLDLLSKSLRCLSRR